MTGSRRPGCELCEQPGGVLVHQGPAWRVVRVVDAAFPGFYRVIRQDHVAEFSDLSADQRRLGMDLVVTVEQVLRDLLRPTKINLASFGNLVPHLHWHVIARFDWDSHFPQPVWGLVQRAVDPTPERRLPVSLAALDAHMTAALGAQATSGD